MTKKSKTIYIYENNAQHIFKFFQVSSIKKNIKFVIIHYTGMQSEIESIDRLKDKKCKVSCHYLINRKGHVIQMVKDKNVAWHAGRSKWKICKFKQRFVRY